MKEEQKHIYHDFNSDRILIVTHFNRLKILYCPK